MTRNRIMLIIQSVLWVLTAIALIAADLLIYFEGLAEKEADPMAAIYTTEAVAEKAVFAIPFLVAAVIFTVICALMGVRDEKADRPVKGIAIKKNREDDGLPPSALKIVRLAVLLIAFICIIVGILNGSMQDVLIKATKICTECIGLG